MRTRGTGSISGPFSFVTINYTIEYYGRCYHKDGRHTAITLAQDRIDRHVERVFIQMDEARQSC